MSSELHTESRVLIAGAGVFGLSTALHLVRQGYKDVVVIDPYPVPSLLSAANDINKIIRTEYHYPLYGGLAREAYQAWKNDPLFSPHFHKVGWFTGAAGDDERGKQIVAKIWQQIGAENVRSRARQITCGSDLQAIVPQTVGSSKLKDWEGIFNPEAGWAHSGNALESVAQELQRLGVVFHHGADGTFTGIDHDDTGRVTGVTTQGGRKHRADMIVLAMGASTGARVEVHDMMRAYGYALAMIQLAPAEIPLYRNMPCLHSKTYGYIFEPSVDGRLKVALPGRYAWHADGGVSRPHPAVMSYGHVPEQCRQEMRELLSIFLPQLAKRPFCYEQFCWDADTYDDNFVVDFAPNTDGRVLLATGGSYHGFKFFPTIGRHVVSRMEGKLDAEAKEAWAWRDGERTYATRGDGETRVLDPEVTRVSARL